MRGNTVSVMKKKVALKLRELVPDIPCMRKLFTQRILKAHQAIRLPDEIIQNAERSVEAKAEAVRLCASKWPKLVASDEKKIERIFSKAAIYRGITEERRQKIKTDMLFHHYAYGFVPDEYVTYDLEHRTAEETKTFISESEHMCFSCLMNDVLAWQMFNDKMKTYQRFQPYYGREIIVVEKKADFAAFEQFVKRHPVFVKKNVYESCGKSIEKIDAAKSGKTARELFDTFLAEGKTIIEECVEQSSETAVFNASSVNTVRCITFHTKHGVVAPYCFFKTGRSGSFVDNGGAGGIFAGIDEKTGVLNTNGIDETHAVFEQHPDSGVPFVGYQLPKWDEMIQMCIEMSSKVSKVKYIGWDLAYTQDHKWVVIEGNGLSQFIGPQSTMQRGIKEEVLALMADMELTV